MTAATADLTIDAKPRDKVRLTVTDPAGNAEVVGSPYKNPTAAPGTWRVKAEAAGCATEERVLNVPPDEATLEKLELKPLGGLSVTGTPAGAAVKVTGPNDWSDDGGLPAEWSGLPSGVYQVSVSREGYQPFEQRATVQPGQLATVSVVLQKLIARVATPAVSKASSPTSPRQVFIEDLKVELTGWKAADAEALGKALAADVQAVIAENSGYTPMTFDNLKLQLRKQKMESLLSSSRTDHAAVQRILDNYACEERLFGTVRQVGNQAQVSLTHFRNEKLVRVANAYSAANPSAVAEAARRLARELFP